MTPTEYAANVAARFGRKFGTPNALPSVTDLALIENRAMRASFGISNMARDQWDKTSHTPEGRAKIVEASNRRGELSVQRALTYLTKPMTMTDLARASGMPETTTKQALVRALDAGKVIKRKLKSMTIWETRLEAAE